MPEQYSVAHWEMLFAAVGQVVLLAMLIERALSVVFEADPIEKALKGSLDGRAIKEIVVVAVSWIAVWQAKIDLLAVFQPKSPGESFFGLGYFLTAAVVAGGSKGAMVLFNDILGFAKEYRKRRFELRSITPEAGASETAAGGTDRARAPWWRGPSSNS
jgi:hypothetical protein